MGLPLSDQEKALYDEAMRAEYARRFLFYQPHLKQQSFHDAGLIAKERLFLAGNRTGKTYGVSAEVCMHITGNYPSWWKGYRYSKPINCWVVGPSSQVVRDTLQKQYYLGDPDKATLGLIHPSLIVDVQKSRGTVDAVDTVYVRHSSGSVSKVSFKSYEQGREKFQGDKVNVIHIDEECSMPIYHECRMRTMATDSNFHGMMVVSMTPLKGQTELISYFIDNRQPDTIQDSRWHTVATWDDNPHLPDDEKARMLEGMTEQERDARTKGIVWIGAGLVYPLPEEAYLVDDFEIPKNWPRAFGMDFGWTKPTALCFGAHDKNNDIVYLYAEYSVCQQTPEQHAFDLMPFGVNWIPGAYDPSGDNSSQINGEKLAPMYRNSGFQLSPADNDVHSGTQVVLSRMRRGQLKIFKSLRKTRAELQKYAYDEKGKILKKNDHLMDGMRYLVMTGLSIAVPENYRDPSYRGRYGRSSQPGYI